MKPQHRALLIRSLGGMALLAALIGWVGLDALAENLNRFHPLWYLLALALIFVHFLVQSLVIRILLHTKQVFVRARSVFRLMIISHFFGVFLPGGIGPDMVLCYNMVRTSEKKETALSAIIFIRIAILFAMAVIAFGFSFHPLAPGVEIQLATGGILLAFLGYFFIMANQTSLSLAEKLLAFLNRYRVTRILYKTYFALASYSREPGVRLKLAPLLLASAIIKIITDYYIALALGFDIPLLYFFIFIPIITVISAIPITFAGLGVREGSYVGLFALAGIPAAEAITVSLVSFTLVIWTAVIGAILYAVKGTDILTHEPGGPSS